jgi:hypothetical protein
VVLLVGRSVNDGVCCLIWCGWGRTTRWSSYKKNKINITGSKDTFFFVAKIK